MGRLHASTTRRAAAAHAFRTTCVARSGDRLEEQEKATNTADHYEYGAGEAGYADARPATQAVWVLHERTVPAPEPVYTFSRRFDELLKCIPGAVAGTVFFVLRLTSQGGGPMDGERFATRRGGRTAQGFLGRRGGYRSFSPMRKERK